MFIASRLRLQYGGHARFPRGWPLHWPNHMNGEGEKEGRSLPECRFHPDAAAVALHDALTDRQADSGSRIRMPVQPLENSKDLLNIVGVDPDAVVPHGEMPFFVLTPGANVNLRRVRGTVFDRVADQI